MSLKRITHATKIYTTLVNAEHFQVSFVQVKQVAYSKFAMKDK